MNKNTPAGLMAAFSLCIALMGCASASNITSLGNDTYSITREATTAFTRNPERLADEARDAAAKFCASEGKEMKIVSVKAGEPHFGGGYASAKIVFKALKPGDPALTSEPVPAEPVEQPMAAPAPAPASTDLYAELTKLDELRQKGILTEEEFQAQKKKVLVRSN
ncbi:MAG: SHOCT domain-containing protein [Opitutaceae bacterium]|nr:SHOCT domain-containing protein [Opitutaceae bacterium]